MPQILLAIYLVLVGLRILFDLDLPSWVTGLVALAAGLLMLAERFRITAQRK